MTRLILVAALALSACAVDVATDVASSSLCTAADQAAGLCSSPFDPPSQTEGQSPTFAPGGEVVDHAACSGSGWGGCSTGVNCYATFWFPFYGVWSVVCDFAGADCHTLGCNWYPGAMR